MGEIRVHEFMRLDGVIDAPTWTFDYGFHPEMGEAIGKVTERSSAILLGRTTYELFEPSWSTRTAEDDPGAPFFNETTKYAVSGTLTEATRGNSETLTREAGPRLFPEGAPPRKFSLARADAYDNGAVYVAYRPQTEED